MNLATGQDQARAERTAKLLTADLSPAQVGYAAGMLEQVADPSIAEPVDAEFGPGASRGFAEVAAVIRAQAGDLEAGE